MNTIENIKKKSFIFNVEWQEILLDYPAEVRLEVYDAIIGYAASGTLSELKPMAKMAFSFIKKEIDSNNEKDEVLTTKRSKAGRKSAQKRYQQVETNPTCVESVEHNLTNLTCVESVEHNLTNLTCVESVEHKEKERNKEKERKERKKETTPYGRSKEIAADAATASRKEKFYQSLIPYGDKYPKETLRAFFDYWSELNRSGTKMRCELEKTWELSKRLALWAKREKCPDKRTYNADVGVILRNNSPDKYDNDSEKWKR